MHIIVTSQANRGYQTVGVQHVHYNAINSFLGYICIAELRREIYNSLEFYNQGFHLLALFFRNLINRSTLKLAAPF